MSEERVGVNDFGTMRQGGKDMSSAGKRLTDAMNKHKGNIEGITASKPWGNDDIGHAFEGPYLKAQGQMFDAVPKVGEAVDHVGTGIGKIADGYEQVDESNSSGLRKSIKDL